MYLNNRLLTNLQPRQRLRVLVVDSSDDYCYMMAVLLQLYGMVVLTASSTQQALEIFMKWQPDIFVSEVALPNDDSCTLIRQVRTKALEHAKVVLTVALTDYDNQNICDGFDIQFTKPLELDEFVAELDCLATIHPYRLGKIGLEQLIESMEKPHSKNFEVFFMRLWNNYR